MHSVGLHVVVINFKRLLVTGMDKCIICFGQNRGQTMLIDGLAG